MNCANHPDREKTAFCQNCGKPICQECTRVVGNAIFCEPCLAAKLSGAGAPPPGPSGSYTYTGEGGPNYTVSGPVYPPGGPNPALAALLGIIPGVGAMYNGQFAKGIVHLVIFAVLITLSKENGIFGLFIAGWVCYQVIEAYHTARARRDGTPLPNPFGLNDLGDRLGFGRAWPGVGVSTPVPPVEPIPPVPPVTPPASSFVPPAAGYTYNYPPPQGANWGAPVDTYPTNPYATTPVPPYDPSTAPVPRNRFPMGAIWLIGLGVLFLLGKSDLFHWFRSEQIIAFFLIGLGIWLFIHKMTVSGPGLQDDGTAYYRVRLLGALRGAVWVVLVGVLFLLSSFGISWGRTWPLFIILAGLMAIFEKTASSAGHPPFYPPPVPPSPPPASSVVPEPSSPASNPQHDQEER
jgi:B-box zinc finger